MAQNPTDTIQAPLGMATAYAIADVPRSHAQRIVGCTPARRGQMKLSPLLKTIQRRLQAVANLGDINGTAVWLSESGEFDKFLIFSSTHIFSTSLFNVWQYDERVDGQHSYYSLNAPTAVSGSIGGNATSGVVTVQFETELIISNGGTLMRYYVSESGGDQGTEYIFLLGVETPGVPTLTQTTGGSLTLLQTYSYLVTYVDEKQRESSPSPAASITLSGSNNAVTVAQNAGPYGSGGGETYWNIYRLNPGQSVYKLVTQLPLGTTSYTDTASDDTINASAQSAPSAGENDPPGVLGPPFRGLSNIMTVWKDRLILNDENAPNKIQVSNAGSPTQFSSLPLPTNIADGLRFTIGGPGQNEVTGLASLGSLLAMFGREAMDLLYGDDITSFTQRTTLARGCQNPGSVQRCENEILFLSDDGVYAVGYEDGYTVQKRSSDIEDLFRGFTPTAQVGNPAAIGRLSSVQVSNALFGNVTSFYSENRYYLSFGNGTVVYDVQSGGWSDTGWGFVKTVTRYLSQMNQLAGSAPETVFLTIGDVNDFAQVLNYFTVADTPTDRDAPYSAISSIILRPTNLEGLGVQQNTKRPVLLSQYGSTGAAQGSVIGMAKWWGDGYLLGTQPIRKGIVWKRKAALFELSPPPYTAELAWVELSFTVNDLILGNTEIEMVVCN